MKEIKFKPTVEGMSGEVVLLVPMYKERAAYLKEMSKLKSGDEVDGAALAGFLYDLAVKHVVSFNVSFDGMSFDKIDELEYYKEGSEFIQQVGLAVVTGVSLGKS
jgi:hypothetical protein